MFSTLKMQPRPVAGISNQKLGGLNLGPDQRLVAVLALRSFSKGFHQTRISGAP